MPPPLRPVDDRALFEAEAAAIRRFARQFDAVFVGRCGFHMLREEPGLVNVFIHADAEFRAGRLKETYGMDPGEAGPLIEKSDRERGKFIKAMTGADWTDARNYHLAIDTGKTGLATAGEMILLQVEEVRAKVS